MKTITNGNTTGGIGTISRYSLEYHASNPSAGELVVLSPNYLDVPKHSGGRCEIYEYPCELSSSLGHDINSFRGLYKKDIQNIGTIMDDENVDLVHPNGTYYYPWLLLNAAKERDLPLVVEFADILENETSGAIWHEMTGESVDVERNAYIFPSQLTKKTAERIHGVEFEKSLVSYNGLDTVYFDDRLGTLEGEGYEGDLSIGFVGRISNVKNPEYLLQLRNALNRDNVKANIFCVSGSTHDSLHGKKLDVYTSLLEAGVTFLEPMSAADLSKFYRTMDYVVSPSHFETFGNVPLEALASGTKALVNRNMGVAEVFDSVGLNEFVVDFNDDSYVVDLLTTKQEESVPDSVRSTLQEQFNWDRILSARADFKKAFLRSR